MVCLTAQGTRLPDTDHSLKAGTRGPVLLQDHHLREKGRKLAEAKKTAPTRPHPHTPAAPGVLKSTGPIAATADKVRDAMTDRGTS